MGWEEELVKPSHMPGITLCPLIPRSCHPLPLPASPLLHPPLPWMGHLHLSCPVVSRRSWGPGRVRDRKEEEVWSSWVTLSPSACPQEPSPSGSLMHDGRRAWALELGPLFKLCSMTS